MPEHQADPDQKWVILVHGGAKTIPPEQADAHRRGCLEALQAGRTVLELGGRAVDAVETAIRVLESDPTFNAGYGSVLTTDKQIEMDSGLMDGETLDVGAVAGIRGVTHPVSVARMLLPEERTLLQGDGARRFAQEHHAELCAPDALITEERLKEASDTVGCVALDVWGHLAAGTSTGGLDGQPPGRVGDSPLAGCGFYAEDGSGAVALSGDGERITRFMLSGRVMAAMNSGDPSVIMGTVATAMRERVGGEVGGVVIDGTGVPGWAHTSDHFAVAYETSSMHGPAMYLSKQEEQEAAHGAP
ncbi:isoaspartyl peptidase/L-asparaginase family protein [Deinococcus altitudinis]|uniref:isoaspartyl peptidase/L-asparaginase family protein n=1 Tax=Deinococcus altitudinis TaxID=468914 RepID=UPI0038927960